MNYQQVSDNIIRNIGGTRNVTKLIHCATRLRFTLQDTGQADIEQLKKIDGVLTVIVSGGQTQLVIGDEVGNLFNVLQKKLGQASTEEIESSPREELPAGNVLERLIKTISGIFIPLIGLIAATGILKGFLTAAVVLNVVSDKSST